MLKIFLTHNPEDLQVYFKKAHATLDDLAELVLNPETRNLQTDEVVDLAQDCQVIICHRSNSGDAAIFNKLPELAVFLRPQLDVRDIDLQAASANGVLVANSVPSFIPATAEIALALMLDLARDVTSSTIAFKAGEMPPSTMGLQLSGSTAGIIGYGAVGSYLADKLAMLGMQVLVTDPYVNVCKPGIEQVSLEQLLKASDFVLPLANASKETENMIDAETLALMKPDACFINVSRGNLVDETALEEAIITGRIRKVALDVGRGSDQRPTHRLAGLPGVVATPHLGGLTTQNAEAQAWSAVEQVKAILDRKMPPRAINPDDATRLNKLFATL